MEQVMQAPNGKFYFKKYNENGDSIFCSEIIYKTEVEANKAMKEHKIGKQKEEKPETTDKELTGVDVIVTDNIPKAVKKKAVKKAK